MLAMYKDNSFSYKISTVYPIKFDTNPFSSITYTLQFKQRITLVEGRDRIPIC